MLLAIRSLVHEVMARQAPPGAEGPMPSATVTRSEQNRINEIIAVSVFSIILATVPVGARLIFRRTSKIGWKLDDYTIALAAFFAVSDAALYLACLRFGFGRRMMNLQPADITMFFKLAYATFLLYGISVTFVKFSVLAFYDRIFPRNKFKWWLIILAVASLAWGIVMTFVSIFQCDPVQGAWTGEGECHNYLHLYLAMQTLNIVLDIAIIILPIRAVMDLQMARANKISVIGTFALGGLSIVFAIIRLAILVRDRNQTDITYDIATGIWSLIEPAFEVFCACLPTLSPLIKFGRHIVEKSSGWSSRFSSGWSKKSLNSPSEKHLNSGNSGNTGNSNSGYRLPSHESKESPYSSRGMEQDVYQTRREEDFEVHPTTGYYLASVNRDP